MINSSAVSTSEAAQCNSGVKTMEESGTPSESTSPTTSDPINPFTATDTDPAHHFTAGNDHPANPFVTDDDPANPFTTNPDPANPFSAGADPANPSSANTDPNDTRSLFPEPSYSTSTASTINHPDTTTTTKSTNTSRFVRRLDDLPPLSDALNLAVDTYSKVKSVRGVGVMVGAAEISLRAAVAVAYPLSSPVLAGVGGWTALDEWACRGLDTVENFLPALKQPTKQVVGQARDQVLGVVAGSSWDQVLGVVAGSSSSSPPPPPPLTLTTALAARAASTVRQVCERGYGRAVVGAAHTWLDYAHTCLNTDWSAEDLGLRRKAVVVRTAALMVETRRCLLNLVSSLLEMQRQREDSTRREEDDPLEERQSRLGNSSSNGVAGLRQVVTLVVIVMENLRNFASQIVSSIKGKMVVSPEVYIIWLALLAHFHYRLALLARTIRERMDRLLVRMLRRQRKQVTFALSCTSVWSELLQTVE